MAYAELSRHARRRGATAADRNALAFYGRRRVAKPWLFRAFARGKPALVLVADQGSPAKQMSRFADALDRGIAA